MKICQTTCKRHLCIWLCIIKKLKTYEFPHHICKHMRPKISTKIKMHTAGLLCLLCNESPCRLTLFQKSMKGVVAKLFQPKLLAPSPTPSPHTLNFQIYPIVSTYVDINVPNAYCFLLYALVLSTYKCYNLQFNF